MIHYLPPLQIGKRPYCLPISSSTAMTLLTALTDTSSDQRLRHLQSSLAQSPSFLGWALLSDPAVIGGDDRKHAFAHLALHAYNRLIAIPPQTHPAPPSDSPAPTHEWLSSLREYFKELDSFSTSSTSTHSAQTMIAAPDRLGSWIATTSGALIADATAPLTDIEFSPSFWTELADARRALAPPRETIMAEWEALLDAANQSDVPTQAFQHLLSRIAGPHLGHEELQQAKLASMKQLAYGASHEINNPLANIASRAQTLLLDEQEPERRRKLASINQQAFRAHEMIADMMLFAHPPAAQRTDVDLACIAKSSVDAMRGMAEQQGTDLILETEPVRSMSADSNQIEIAINALIQNGLESNQQGGKVVIQVTPNAKLKSAQVAVHDEGPGIAPEHHPHVFDPFFSGREAGRGLGFGLSKAWRITELHQGEITFQPSPYGGALFQIKLPYVHEDGSNNQDCVQDFR